MENKVIRDASLTIATTDTTISEQVNNGQREVLTMTNTSTAAEVISISVGNSPASGKGIVLQANQAAIFSKDSGYSPSNLRVAAVASAGTATLAIHEEIGVFN